MLGDFAGLLLNGIGGILDQAIGRDDEEKAVYRAVGAILLEQSEEFLPLAGFARLDILKHQPAGGVKQNGVVGEPPVHVDGAANSLELVLHAGRETDVAVADGLSLARPGLSHDHIPRKLVEIFASRFVSIDAGLKFFPHVVEPGALAGIAQAAGCGRAVLGNFASELLVLLLLDPAFPEVIADGDERQEKHGDHQKDL